MYTKQIFLLLTAITIFYSCKKDNTPIVNSADGNYLSTIYFVRGNGSTIDTVTSFFDYDNTKRVSLYIETLTYNQNGVITKYLDTTRFFYNSSEILPYKTTKIVKNPSTIDTIHRFFSYSNQGML